MKRYIIERDIPGVGSLDAAQLQSTAKAGNEAVAELAGKVQWEQSFVVADKTFCVFRADGEDALKSHAKLSGFPITRITEINAVIDPVGGS